MTYVMIIKNVEAREMGLFYITNQKFAEDLRKVKKLSVRIIDNRKGYKGLLSLSLLPLFALPVERSVK